MFRGVLCSFRTTGFFKLKHEMLRYEIWPFFILYLLKESRTQNVPFEPAPNKKYSYIQSIHSHFNVITTTAKRFKGYRPVPNTLHINNQSDILYRICELDYDLWCSLVTNTFNSAASSELFPEPSHEVLRAVVGVDLQVDKPHKDAAKGAQT
jgi:hypothetical protein